MVLHFSEKTGIFFSLADRTSESKLMINSFLLKISFCQILIGRIFKRAVDKKEKQQR
jgi:hypothetical protein